MFRPLSPCWRWPVLLGLTSCLSWLCGCVSNLVWLPDGSGVIYSNKEGTSLRHYDLASKKSRVIVVDSKCKTPGLDSARTASSSASPG